MMSDHKITTTTHYNYKVGSALRQRERQRKRPLNKIRRCTAFHSAFQATRPLPTINLSFAVRAADQEVGGRLDRKEGMNTKGRELTYRQMMNRNCSAQTAAAQTNQMWFTSCNPQSLLLLLCLVVLPL